MQTEEFQASMQEASVDLISDPRRTYVQNRIGDMLPKAARTLELLLETAPPATQLKAALAIIALAGIRPPDGASGQDLQEYQKFLDTVGANPGHTLQNLTLVQNNMANMFGQIPEAFREAISRTAPPLLLPDECVGTESEPVDAPID
jgi:hypothetical protein